MKKQYYVYEDYSINATDDPLGHLVKKFKHQNEAIDFVENDKNIQQYNGLSLYTYSGDALLYRYIGAGQWEAVQ